MKRIIAALVFISVALSIGLSIGPRPADAERIMAQPENQIELEYRRSL